ncbi:hypothetical protein Sjap_018154 [Stephania japonica]|uniref:Uncharacterized protein n=1 Tax=Stephania japonica TaxID=461633 RepID=A0AAP0NKT6_9MAGN
MDRSPSHTIWLPQASLSPPQTRTCALRDKYTCLASLVQHGCNRSHQNFAVKRAWARVVLGWVTSREVLNSSVVPDSLNLCTYPSGRKFESGGRKTGLREPDGVGRAAVHGSHYLCGAKGGL